MLSLNVRGARDSEKRRAIFDKHRFHSDVLILLETHSSPEIESIWEKEWGGKVFFSHGANVARGVAIFMVKNFTGVITNIYRDNIGRTVMVDIKLNEKYITLVAIYAPNEDSPRYFEDLSNVLKDRHEHKILIGDYNLTLDVELDRLNTYSNNNRAKREVENIMDQYYLKEVWRVVNGDKREYSWSKKGSRPKKASRIDFALVSAGLDQQVELIQYISSICTDHRAVYMCVNLEPFERGAGYWKFNTTFLQNKEFVEKMNLEIETTLQATNNQSPIGKWETLKKRIKKFAQNFVRNSVTQDKIVIAQLSERVNEYESRLPLLEEEDNLLELTRAELEEKTLERIKGVIFRSKCKWYEQGERNTKYFYSLEKAKYNAKTCYKIIDDQGQELVQADQIITKQYKFYSELYQEEKDVIFTLKNNSSTRVPQEIKIMQEQQLTIRDLEEAIKTMNNQKTPGEDGIPVDFYKVFWVRIKECFFGMVGQCYEQGQLHESARTGILNLIPKAEKDTRYIKNLHPITLLNTDYKIIEKAIANKMIPALEHIIHGDQRGFMKERRISVNIRKMLDIIHQAEKEDLEAIVLSLDFVKCFDRCSFSILFGSLDFFDFGDMVKDWTYILYKKFRVKIQNNGHFSQYIDISRGVHQGGCCSSVYFLVIAEILAMSLRDNKDIDGLTITM